MASEGTHPTVDVLIPTCDRPAALSVTLGCLVGSGYPNLRIVVSDQGVGTNVAEVDEVTAVTRVLQTQGRVVELHKHLPRRGIAEHRQYLLEQATADYMLFLDDDIILEPDVINRLTRHLTEQECGFIGAFVSAPSALDSDKPIDEPADDMRFEIWEGRVAPEVVLPGTNSWERRHLHFAAHPYRLAQRLGLDDRGDFLYKVAWVGGCVLYDTHKLRSVGGFEFWRHLPPDHSGEDVLAQLRAMARYGGAALHPSGAWHQEVPTTTPERSVDAPLVLDVLEGGAAAS